MSRRRKKKKSYVGKTIFCIILIIIGAAIIYSLFKDPVKKSVQKSVTKVAIEQVIKSETGEDVDIDSVMDTMDEEDESACQEIIDKYSSSDTISEAASVYKSSGGDLSEVKSYLKDEVSTEDMAKLKELYYKYQDEVQ